MRPKPPPKYRILVMMATNMPEALDEALLRPGRIDRIYRVGYPSKAGRVRTYEGYLDKVQHELTDEQIDKLATITPYATGATIKDLVNEALIIAIRDGREIITWKDVIRAKQLKDLGPPEDVEYIERERHAVAVHEACHAVVALPHAAAHGDRHRDDREGQRLPRHGRQHPAGGPVHPVAHASTRADILVSPRLAGRRADVLRRRQLLRRLRRPGVGHRGRRRSWRATGAWGTPCPRTPRRAGSRSAAPAAAAAARRRVESTEKVLRAALADRIEDQLADLLTKAEEILRENRREVLALAHALETHKTLTGEDVEAVLDQRIGISVDGTVYSDPEFIEKLEEYHSAAAGAHIGHSKIDGSMPEGGRLAPPPAPEPEPEPVAAGPYAGYGYGQPQGYGVPAPGNGQSGPWQGGPGYGYPPPGPAGNGGPGHGGAGNGGTGNGTGYGAPGYPPPPPVQGWGRPEPGSDTPTQAYGPGQAPPAGSEPGADAPTQVYGPGNGNGSGNGNGQAGHDSGQTAPAAWYPTEPLHQQPDTGPVHIVGEQPLDTPPTGEARVDQPEHRESAEPSPNGQTERRAEPESNDDEARPGQA